MSQGLILWLMEVIWPGDGTRFPGLFVLDGMGFTAYQQLATTLQPTMK